MNFLIESIYYAHTIHMKKKILRPFDYYVLLFFTAAFTGWIWEVLLYLVTAHAFVNRGIYRGPYLPIYGIGSVILMLVFHKLRRHPFWVFTLSTLVCTTLEYFSGMWLEWKWGVRWWDYSGHVCNINGHICLTSSIGFGLGGVVLICIFQPIFNTFYHRMTLRQRILLCLVCLFVFIADATYATVKPHTGQNISTTCSYCFHSNIHVTALL